jgi:hypothetical protein
LTSCVSAFISSEFAAVALLAVCKFALKSARRRRRQDEGGLPLKGVTITADSSNIDRTLTATTDDEGRPACRTRGRWRFIAQAPGFAAEVGTMPVRMGGPMPVSFTLHKTASASSAPSVASPTASCKPLTPATPPIAGGGRRDRGVRGALSRSAALTIINLQIAEAAPQARLRRSARSYRALLAVDPDHGGCLGIAATERERQRRCR